jgi:alkylation response protein AidB-like acyl-CoA dehydrogenase
MLSVILEPSSRTMDFELNQGQRMIRDFVERLSTRYGREYWLRKAQSGEPPEEMWQELGKGGYLGMLVPEAYDGAGLGMLDMDIFLEALGEKGTPLLFLVVSTVMGTLALVRHGSEEQKRRFLPPLASGGLKLCFALTEPDAGSNSFRISSMAKRDGRGWILNGRKTYISGADEADYILTVARTTPYDDASPKDKRKGLSLFLVPTDARGLEMRKIPVAIEGPESQFLLFFDSVALPAESLVGVEGEGARSMFEVLNAERICGAALGVGLGRFLVEKAVRYARERKVWDVPIGAHQGLQHPLAMVKSRLEMASLMGQKASWLFDRGENAGPEAAIAKYEAAEAAITACDLAIEVHGGNGFSREYDVITVWPWVRLLRTAPLSREMILNYIGEHVLGLPRSY